MTSTGTFSQRLDHLRPMGGGGRLVGSVTVDQVYAHRQHEDMSYHPPRGGGPKYLQKPLMTHYRDYIGDYAKTVLDDGGQAAMRRSMEHLSDEVEVTAPREWGDLLTSGHPKVTQAGRTLYDRPPDRKSTRLNSSHLGISYA